MTPPDRLRQAAADAGDEQIPGLWVTSKTARLLMHRDSLRALGDRTDTAACLARADVEAAVFAELEEGDNGR